MKGKVMGVDPGESRIGIALSDPEGKIAFPHSMIHHTSRNVDAAQIALIAIENSVIAIVIGMALDSEGEPGPQARKAFRLAEAIRAQTDIPVIMWDESNTTQTAQESQTFLRVPVRSRKKSIDSLAALFILRSYLESLETRSNTE